MRRADLSTSAELLVNCCWRESTSGFQFYCNSLPMNFIIDQHVILCYRRIMNSSNAILHALLHTKQCRVLSLLAKYNILSLSLSQRLIKSCIWNSFVTKSVRAGHISVNVLNNVTVCGL